MNAQQRLPALDAMRGLVMAVMAVDHVDVLLNPRHSMADSASMPQSALSAPDFLTRWCTHLCAPTFVFLAGASIALAAARRPDVAAQRAFDRHLALRAAILLVIEFTFLSACFRLSEGPPSWAFTTWTPIFAQVIYAIAASMLLLIVLRRLPSVLQIAIAVACLVGVELLNPAPVNASLLRLMTLHFGVWGEFDVLVLYPVLAWLPAMLMGHVVGRRLARGAVSPRAWLLAGAVSLLVFVALRHANGFGNMGLHRRDGSLLEWLHCSKYPVSITFLAMELGLMALCLGAWTHWFAKREGRANGLLLVLGQVPLFFYLLHLPLIGAIDRLGVFGMLNGWGVSWLMALLVSALLYWPCRLYRDHRQRRGGWTRYL